MKKIILILLIIFITSFNVQAMESNGDLKGNSSLPSSVQQVESQEIERFYDYISSMKTKHELLEDIDVKTYVKDFMKTGDGKLSTKKIN